MTPGLLAERKGVPVAAIALTSGTVAAEPGDPAGDASGKPRAREVTYATGLAIPTSPRRRRLVLARRMCGLRSGRYTVVLRTLHGHVNTKN
jgi:hypothetical protein